LRDHARIGGSTREERIDRDAGSGEILRPDDGGCFERRLRWTVGREAVHHHCEKACHDVDDPPPALLDQAWGYRPGHHEWSVEIHIYCTAPGVRIHFEEALAAPDQKLPMCCMPTPALLTSPCTAPK